MSDLEKPHRIGPPLRARHLAASGVTDRLTLVRRLLPEQARGWARQLVNFDPRPAPSLESWSRPLIARRSGPPPLPAPPAADPAGRAPGRAFTSPTPPHAPRPAHAADSQPPARCLIVTSALDIGGLAAVAAFLGRHLRVHGLETAVLDIRPNPSASGAASNPLGQSLEADGVEVRETSPVEAPRWIERWQPDVMSLHGMLPDCVLEVAGRAGVPCVETLHSPASLFGADWEAETARSGRLAAIACVSERVREMYLAGNRDFPPDRIVTIPNGIAPGRRPVRNRAAARDRLGLADEFLFVSLSRYHLEKNPYGLLNAFDVLARRQPRAHLLIAGPTRDSGPRKDFRYLRHVVRLRESLPCRDRIHLRDKIDDPADLLAAADGFALDSFFEGGPLVSMEALAAGTPVVISDVGGAREQIADDPARGYVVANPLGDPLLLTWPAMAAARYRPQANRDEFADAMDRLIADRDHYLADRDRLAAESAARFSAADCAARHAAMLRAVASGTDLPGVEQLSAANSPVT